MANFKTREERARLYEVEEQSTENCSTFFSRCETCLENSHETTSSNASNPNTHVRKLAFLFLSHFLEVKIDTGSNTKQKRAACHGCMFTNSKYVEQSKENFFLSLGVKHLIFPKYITIDNWLFDKALIFCFDFELSKIATENRNGFHHFKQRKKKQGKIVFF